MTIHPPPLAAALGQLAAISVHAHAALRCIARAQAPADAHAAPAAVLAASRRASAIVHGMRALPHGEEAGHG